MNLRSKRGEIKLCTANTKYKVVKHVGKSLGWTLTKRQDPEHWNLIWLDSTAPPSLLSAMKPYQRVNHFPGMYAIARKSNLCMNLNKLRKLLPTDFDFYPRTWFLPSEFHDFESHSFKTPGSYIVKPSASSQGRGIYLVQTAKEVAEAGNCIVQEYIERPFLIEGLKFDMRIYVLVTSCNPLRIFVHQEGLARFATEKYKRPAMGNIENACMHLTNYSVNKLSSKFVKNTSADHDDVGHKRSLKSTLNQLKSRGHNVAKMWNKVSDIIIKTLCSIQPSLSHTYRSCRPNDLTNAMCFEILGFDIILDENFKPWLLEVNHSPSFETSTPLDKKIKSTVIRDSLRLLNLSFKDKESYELANRMKIEERSVFRKSFYEKMQEVAEKKEQVVAERDLYEESNLGGFTKIFAAADEYYGFILRQASSIMERFTGARKTEPRRRPATGGRTSVTPQPSFKAPSSHSVRKARGLHRDLTRSRDYKLT